MISRSAASRDVKAALKEARPVLVPSNAQSSYVLQNDLRKHTLEMAEEQRQSKRTKYAPPMVETMSVREKQLLRENRLRKTGISRVPAHSIQSITSAVVRRDITAHSSRKVDREVPTVASMRDILDMRQEPREKNRYTNVRVKETRRDSQYSQSTNGSIIVNQSLFVSKPDIQQRKATVVKVIRNSAVASQRVVFRSKIDRLATDPMLVEEYEHDIYLYCKELEISNKPDHGYILRQPDLNWSMRHTLLNWIIQIHSQFKLQPETLFLTVNLIDRTLSLKTISVGKLQLVGITALLIASKYEEIMSPSIQDLVFMTDNAFSCNEVLAAERYMLGIVDYQIGYPNPLNFLRRVGRNNRDVKVELLASYFLEVMVLGPQFIQYSSSHLAAAGYFLSIKAIYDAPWTNELATLIGYSEAMLLECVYGLLSFLKTDKYETVFVKFSNSSCMAVSVGMRRFLQLKGL